MAQRRMFSLKIIDTDLFLDMPVTARLLYYDLSMRADDDGFVSSPKKIQRMIGCSDDDLKLLMAKQFIIPFSNGICVIKHWRIHNYIRADRHVDTIYKEEKEQLIENDGAYELACQPNVIPSVNQMSYQMDTQVRLGKDRLGKVNNKKKKKSSIDSLIEEYTENKKLIETLKDFLRMRKSNKKPLTNRGMELLLSKLNKLTGSDNEKIEILNQSIFNSWQGVFPLKKEASNGTTKQNKDTTTDPDREGIGFKL
ncbi:phage replication initiation protein [Clostridium felsineum]|uniref:phage replication initiation protein n=1 Tax=Clostridium felsineum TaxID=36839 RepID=UPI00214D5449|nr:phage replication initiation protein [Clostridium felsineum]MCR3759194.1 phage replication initiation protein [Clostridium felsineum]